LCRGLNGAVASAVYICVCVSVCACVYVYLSVCAGHKTQDLVMAVSSLYLHCLAVCSNKSHFFLEGRVSFFSSIFFRGISVSCICSVLQCVAVCCSVMQLYLCRFVCGVLQYAAVCCSLLQSVAVCCSYTCVFMPVCAAVCYSVLQCVLQCVLQYVAFISVSLCLQCAAYLCLYVCSLLLSVAVFGSALIVSFNV